MYVEGEIPYGNGNGNGYGVLPVMQYAPMGNNNGGFFGNGDGIWAILLFAMIFGNGGWGNGFGGGFGGGAGNMLYDINANTNRGFDNLALNSGIDNLQTAVSNGFANAEVARCNSTTNILQSLNGLNSSISNGFYDLAMANQKCCCQNQLATQDLKATVISENCADREALSNGIRDIIASNTANTQAILDKLCQQEIDAKNDLISTLRSQLSMADLRASQVEQTAQIRAGQNLTMANLVNELRSCPIPAQPVYGSQPIFTCPNSNGGCGCGGTSIQ